MPDEPLTAPEGPVQYAWFGGLLDGRRGDDARLAQAIDSGNRLGLARIELDLDGGRFTVLFDDNSVRGEAMTPGKAEELIAVLNEVVAASADPATVESTLRCTEVYEDGAVDTLFTVSRGEVECLSRPRALGPEDHAHAPREAPPLIELPQVGRRQALGLLALLLVTFGLLGWRYGVVDLVAGRSAEALEVDTGPFGGTLSVEVASHWGSYRVTLRRGEAWPADAAAAQALIDGAGDVESGAAMRAIADGRAVWVQLRDGEGRVLESAEVELARLMRADEDQQEVEVTLPGRYSARVLGLGLESGRSQE